MTDTLIKVDLAESPYENPNVHNRWHPDIPMACWVKPGEDFILETYDWTGGFIKNNDSADDVRDIDLSIVHFLTGPVGVEGAEPGDLLVVDLLDIGAKPDSQWGFNGFFSKQNGGGFLTDHFPQAQKSIWDFHGLYTSSRHIPGVNFAGLIHPGLIGCLPDQAMLETWNKREMDFIATQPDRVPPLANPPFAATAHMGKLQGDARDQAAATGARTVPPRDRSLMSQLPPCSRGGTVRAPVAAAWSRASPCSLPMCAVAAKGGFASGGTRSGCVAIKSISRLFHVSSMAGSGRQPISPGWISPAKFTPGICRDEVYRPWKSQIDFCACGK